MKKSEKLYRQLKCRGDQFTLVEELCLERKYDFLEDQLNHGMPKGILVDAFLENDETRMNLLLSIRLKSEKLYNLVVTTFPVYEFRNLELACILGDDELVEKLREKDDCPLTNIIDEYMHGADLERILEQTAAKIENEME